MTTANLLFKAERFGCFLEDTCVGIGQNAWDKYMKGATRANKKEIVKIALLAGVIDEIEAKLQIKRPHYNPYNHFKTKTHAVYVHSGIEHFIRIQ